MDSCLFIFSHHRCLDENIVSSEDETAITSAVSNISPTSWKSVSNEDFPPRREQDVKKIISCMLKIPFLATGEIWLVNAKKALKMNKENYISNIEVGNTSTDVTHFRGKCKASMNASIHVINLQIVKDTGMVYTAVCTCKACQSGACSQIGVLLIILVKTREAFTSQNCKWNVLIRNPMKLRSSRSCNIHVNNSEKDTKHHTKKLYPGVYRAGPRWILLHYHRTYYRVWKLLIRKCSCVKEPYALKLVTSPVILLTSARTLQRQLKHL